MIGQITCLDSGVTVVLIADLSGGLWDAIVLHSADPGRTGHSVTVSELEIEHGRNVRLNDGVMQMLTAFVPVNGPAALAVLI
jgi:hypothetical protein